MIYVRDFFTLVGLMAAALTITFAIWVFWGVVL